MLCDICQTKTAKIFYTEIVNGEKKEQHLCEDCASEYTAVPLNEIMGGAQGQQLSIGSILSGILSKYAKDNSEEGSGVQKRIDTRCPECGTTESDFLKMGRLGCPVCYNAFSGLITKNFKTMQAGLQHTGKEPVHAKFIEISDNFQGAPAILTPADDGVDESMINEAAAKAEETATALRKGKAGKCSASGTGNNSDRAAEVSAEAAAVEPVSDEVSLTELKNQLASALSVENYELAAALRDRIHAVEGVADTAAGKTKKKTRKKKSEGTD